MLELPMVAAKPKPVPKAWKHHEKESDRVIEPLPLEFRESLQIQGIHSPLSLRFSAHSVVTPPHAPLMLNAGSAREGFSGSVLKRRKGSEKLRESASSPFFGSQLAPELPQIFTPRGTAMMQPPAKPPRKDSVLLKKQAVLHRFGVDFSSGHRIRLLRKARPALRPLMI